MRGPQKRAVKQVAGQGKLNMKVVVVTPARLAADQDGAAAASETDKEQ